MRLEASACAEAAAAEEVLDTTADARLLLLAAAAEDVGVVVAAEAGARMPPTGATKCLDGLVQEKSFSSSSYAAPLPPSPNKSCTHNTHNTHRQNHTTTTLPPPAPQPLTLLDDAPSDDARIGLALPKSATVLAGSAAPPLPPPAPAAADDDGPPPPEAAGEWWAAALCEADGEAVRDEAEEAEAETEVVGANKLLLLFIGVSL
jgi:hypothetical protein